ncbi:putative endonuclease 4 [Vulcanimicrobium alpinum]|uniref:Endonuclease 4 n=1 Tax=Vulcanimicrobium alpinum TaxID=3016050 RepID=A0AAN1XTE1_UNVUL|nr:deoxyribonuclease IV [Vulcanimicrobium alpinum]BDE05360.1 putative endonuclease 4 [Vulcanimicrobium alpinum]
MRIGFHVRVGGGYDAAVAYATKHGCSSLQFFSGNPKTYRIGAIDAPALAKFAAARTAAGVTPVAIHTSYLINLATDDPKIANGSLRLLKNDLAVAAAGDVAYVNTHLGSYGKRDRKEGFAAVVAALEDALEGIAPQVSLVMENSAGAGALCGGTMEELGALVRAVGHPNLRVCIDTAHTWAAGYAIDTPDGVAAFFDHVEREIGLERIVMFHFNDTEIELGGHRDRHWHIGEGRIGIAGFRAIVAHPGVQGKVAILETPGEEGDDARNIAALRTVLEGVGA